METVIHYCKKCKKETEFKSYKVKGAKYIICTECMRYEIQLSETVDHLQLIREANENKPTITCPYCKSTDTKKLGVVDRAISIGTLGIFSNKINKSFQCKDCKGTW